MPVGALIFYLIAALTIGSAMMVAFSRNIVYSAFSLLGTLMGVAGLYALLAADFVAVIQILVMLTHRIDDVAVSNRSVGRLPAALIIGVVGVIMGAGVVGARWAQKADVQVAPTTYGIGEAFLGPYILPFEFASIVLLVVLIGAVVVSRKEIRGETGS